MQDDDIFQFPPGDSDEVDKDDDLEVEIEEAGMHVLGEGGVELPLEDKPEDEVDALVVELPTDEELDALDLKDDVLAEEEDQDE